MFLRLITSNVFLFRLALPRPIYKQNIYGRNVGLIVGSFSLLFLILIATAAICYNKSRKSGHYRTKEDKGADQAIDADTAIIRGDPRHPDVTEAREWFF